MSSPHPKSAVSYAVPVNLTCSRGHPYTADGWLIIDVSEHPELIPTLLDGSFIMPPCPACGRRNPIITQSLLLFSPEHSPPLIFSHLERRSASQLEDELSEYVSFLRQRMGPAWRNEWTLGGVPVVERPNLPEHLKSFIQPGGGSLKQLMGVAARIHQDSANSNDPEALKAALAAWNRVMQHGEFASASPDMQFPVYYMAAEAQRLRYASTGDEKNYAVALYLLGKLQRLPASQYAQHLDELTGMLSLDRHAWTSDAASISEAILRLESALLKLPTQKGRVLLLLNVARAWRHQFILTNAPDAIDRAIELLRLAVAEAPGGSPEASEARNRLATCLDKRHQRFGRSEDLDEALRLYNEVIEASRDDAKLNVAYHGRGCVLLDRYTRHGRVDDLNQAVADLERSLQDEPADVRNRSAYWIDLGNALRTRYEAKGDQADLDAAFRAQERSLQICREHRLDASVPLRNLATLASAGYAISGRLSDLGDAIGYAESAVAETGEGAQNEAESKLNLAILLCERYKQIGGHADLDRAVPVLESALRARIIPEPIRPSVLEMLGTVRLLQYRRAHNPETLDGAIEALTEASGSALASKAMLPGVYGTSSAAFSERYRLTKSSEDIKAALAMARQSLEHRPAGSPLRSQSVIVLGEILEMYAAAMGERQAFEEAVALYREASLDVTNPRSVVTSAAEWARLEFQQSNWKDAAEAFDRALKAKAELVAAQTLRSEKEAWLKDTQGLAANAAFTFAKNGDIGRAVTCLENGAASLLSEMLELGSREQERLRAAGHNEIADAYAAAAEAWRSVARLSLAAGFQINDAALARRMQDARAEFLKILARIREMPGFADFQFAASLAELQATAEMFGGALAYVVVTRHGSLVIFVTAKEVHAIWPTLTDERLWELLVRRSESGELTGYLPAGLGLGSSMDVALAEVLPVLEEQLAAPLRDVLRRFNYRRVGLVLTGRIGLLPVGACLLNDAGVQVQANGRSLRAALGLAQRRSDNKTVLAVGNPLPSDKPLPAAEMEAQAVGAHFAEATVMTGTEVDRNRVIEALTSASHLHFACHGYTVPHDIMRSALSLGGAGELTVGDLLFGPSAPARARLAVLSACQSAVSDFARLPDEVIGLPVAFLEAGVPGVVGTLWPVNDLSTALLIDRFHQGYMRERLRPAEALNAAQQWLRSATAAELVRYFSALRQKDDAERRVPYEFVSSAWRHFAAMPPASTPFNSPVHWGPFVFYGN